MERDLAAPPGAGGRHPLPDAERFAAAASRAGIGPETFVVAYGSLGGAERLWWLLRHFGHDACAVLDLEGWLGPLTAGEERAAPARFEPRERTGDTISREELAAQREQLVVVDARLEPRWRGEPNPVDRVPGRIPARSTALERSRDVITSSSGRRRRRVLRVRGHRLRARPPSLPRRKRGAALPGLVVGVGAVSGAAGRAFDLR